MTLNITEIKDKKLVELIGRIDYSIKENNLTDSFLYMYTPREIAEELFPDANYADINILISASNITYHVIGTTALDKIIVYPLPATNFNILRFDEYTEEQFYD